MTTSTFINVCVFAVHKGYDTVETISKLHKDRYRNNTELFETDEYGDPIDELISPIEPYLSIEDGKVIVTVNSESYEGNYDLNLYNSICETVVEVQSGLSAEYWTKIDWKEGVNCGTNYYNEDGDKVDIHNLYKICKTLF